MEKIDLTLLNDCFNVIYQHNVLKKQKNVLKQQEKNAKVDNSSDINQIETEIESLNQKYEVALSQLWQQVLIRTDEFIIFLLGKYKFNNSQCSDAIADGIDKLISRVGEHPLNFENEKTFIDFFKFEKLQNLVKDSFAKAKKKPTQIELHESDEGENDNGDYDGDETKGEIKRSIEEIADVDGSKEINKFERKDAVEASKNSLGFYALRAISEVVQERKNNKGLRALRKKIAWQYGVKYEDKLQIKMNEFAYEDLSEVSPVFEIHRYKAWNKISH
ncbi:MAG: hypothetical protein IPQ02_05320 [Saprospiraceae bacterium]|uniref:Uncharacterized protein n=1 Tax=Candidatus Defluviibacterium haderslevense TaxID=2981993 RepID=A0A9D7S7J2_9BACT|nr:hypothetical protein [Candidatus Defluviibacterium haderslevense]MBL0236038.1 hypothetical protein [Candidatus Defluviibacterium haderslevense]